MTEPEKKRTIPWGMMLILSMVATFATVTTVMTLGSEESDPWHAIGAGIVLAVSAFLVMYWMQNGFWGMSAAVLVTLHPAHSGWAGAADQSLWPAALGLALLAVSVAALMLACQRDFAWFKWLILTAAGSLFLTGTWVRWPETAQSASLFVLVAFPLGFLSGLNVYRRGVMRPPSPGNIVCVLFAGLLCHFGGLAGAYVWTGDNAYLDLTLSQFEVFGQSSRWQLRVFETAALVRWCWPNPWTVVPLVIWGLLRTAWRGWKDFKKGRPPASWLLGIYAVITLFSLLTEVDHEERLNVSALATVAVLLVVFGVADVFHGIGERMILAPPEETG